MPDRTLCGNGDECPACATLTEHQMWLANCKTCKGTGRIARPTKDIIADHVAWAREHYWPQFAKEPRNG